MPVFESSSLPDGVNDAPEGAEPRKESLTLTGPHMVVKPGSTGIHSPLVMTPAGPGKEILRPGTNPADRVTRVLAGPHMVVETLPTALSEEEVRIIELHDLGQKLGITLWNTDYEAALNPESPRFQMYNQLVLCDNGDLILTEIKPGAKFTHTLQVDPQRNHMEGSELVRAIRGYIEQNGFKWKNKPEGYLREDVSIEQYRAITANYDESTDAEKLKAMMDPEGSKRGGAIFVFDREATLLPDDPLLIFRLEGCHRAPTDKSGAYSIDDIPHIIRK